MFLSTIITNDGISCLIMGNGDPSVATGNSVAIGTGCSNGTFISTDFGHSQGLWTWDSGSSDWIQNS